MTGLTLFDFDFTGDKPATAPELRPYQQHDVERIEAALQKHRRVLYKLPTGGGKTVVISNIAVKRARRQQRVVILVHRHELLEQASRKIAAYGLGHGLITPDRWTTRDLVQVASIDTVGARMEKLRPLLESVDLVIPDEAHHVVSRKWGRVLDAMKNAEILGPTATPYRTDGRGLGERFATAVEGPSIKALIELGALVPVHVYRPPMKLDLRKVRTRAGDYAIDDLEALINVDEVTKLAIANYRRYADKQSCVVFCLTVKHAHDVAAAFCAVGYRAAAVDGETPPRERARRIRELGSGALQLLMSRDLIGEGVDIPAVSAMIDLRPTKSTLIYQQYRGRVMRPADGKTHSICIDQVDNYKFHGMPDADRPWSLHDGIKKGLERAVNATMRCRRCYRAHEVAPECPGCGKVYPVPKPPEPIEGAGEPAAPGEPLESFSDDQIKRMNYGALMKIAKTEEALERVAKVRGYKRGWVDHRLMEMGEYRRSWGKRRRA